MVFGKTAIRRGSSTDPCVCLCSILLVLVPFCGAIQQNAGAQQQGAICDESSLLTTTQVVEKLAEMNLRRAQALHSYHGTRTYSVEYRGRLGATSAQMVVELTYRAPGTKEFTIQSSTGSTLIIDHVFMKLLQAEKEVLSMDGQQRTALSNENYEFTMVGYECSALRRMYVLAVEPRTTSKFLFRGRVWVDADDFAVVLLQAEPAKNPSFWTKSSQIEQSYQKVSDFWLPERNHSISSMRIGGRTELTIDYQSHKITASEPVRPEPTQQIARSPDITMPHTGNEHLK
jgi:hypothetical protein